jgi:hypothetical protein
LTLYVWPWRTLVPATPRVWVDAPANLGPKSLDDTQQASTTAGGGRVRAVFADIYLLDPNPVRVATAWAGHLDAGVTECIVPLPALYTAPRPYAGGRPMSPGTPAPGDDYFGEAASLGSPMMVATAATAALRAASLTITISRGSRLRGGEWFSLDHGGAIGWRAYHTTRVTDDGDGVFTCGIRPLLRAAITGPKAVELDVPRCVMKLDPAKADELRPELALAREGVVAAHFIESFDY